MEEFKVGDEVILNGRIRPYSRQMKPGSRARVVNPGHDFFVTVQFAGADYETTVPRNAIDHITVLDKLAEIQED